MTTQTTDLDKILKKIQQLIAKAESTQDQFPEEAASFYAKAEALMHQYRIQESMLAAAAPVGQGLVPVWADWDVCLLNNEFVEAYMSLAVSIMVHVGAEGVYSSQRNEEDNQYHRILRVVGYESDLRYGEMLLTAARLAFGEHLEPSYNPDESGQVNAYRMRAAGMEGWRIAYVLWGRKPGAEFANSPNGAGRNAGKARRLYKAEAELRGEAAVAMGQGTNMKTWRASYASGFVGEIASRLYRMRYQSGEESQALVLSGRKEAIKEAFYARYPQYRPTQAKEIGNGRDACKRCAKAKSGFCNDHRHLKPSYSNKDVPFNNRAYSRGGAAAQTVDLDTKGRLT